MSSILGRVVATERRPNTPHEFHFWTALDSPVGIGTIVRVDGRDAVNGTVPRVYGIVTEGFSWTDLASPLHDVMGFDGSPSAESLSQTDRAEIRLYTAAVLRHVPEEPLQPVPMGTVFLAVAMCASILLVTDVLFSLTAAVIVTTVAGATFAWFWYGLPLVRNLRD